MPRIAGPSNRRLPHWQKAIIWGGAVLLVAVVVLSLPVPVAQLQSSNAKTSANPSAADIQVASSLQVPAENTLTIPKLNLHVPVVYGADSDDASFEKALEHGVVHFTGSAHPGEPGNVLIFGHSSNDWWEPGDYKFVFVLLNKMKAGDIIGIDYQSKRHYYVVTGVKIVEPTDVEVMYPTAVPTLTLITCTPPGTSLKRLIVQAREARSSTNTNTAIAVGPATAEAAGAAGAPAALPQTPETIIGTSNLATSIRSFVVGIIEKFVPVN